MRYRRYYVTRHGNGSRTVVSTGPFVAIAAFLVPFFILAVLISFYREVYELHFVAAGVFLILIGICIPGVAGMKSRNVKPETIKGYQIFIGVLLGIAPLFALAHVVAWS